MSEPIITINGQHVYPLGREPMLSPPLVRPDARNAAGRPLAITEMAPSGWASGGNEETFEAGLPFVGGFIGLVALVIVIVLLAKRGR